MKEIVDENYLNAIQLIMEEDQKELQDLDLRIRDISNEIDECETFLNKMETNSMEEARLFSPRNKLHSLEENILDTKNKQKRLEIERKLLYQSRAKLQKRITNVGNVFELSNTLFSKQRDPKIGLYSLFIQEKERERIARDLHDTSLQNITHLIHKVELATKYLDVDLERAKLELNVIIHNLRDVNQDIRNTIYNLKPMVVEDLGFLELIERMKENYKEKCSIEFDIDVDNIDDCNEFLKITLYRIIDEAVNNAMKHSKATRLKIMVKNLSSIIQMEISDNGIGINTQIQDNMQTDKKNFGLKIMKERILLLGGTIDINGEKGTVIKIEVPKLGGIENDTSNVG